MWCLYAKKNARTTDLLADSPRKRWYERVQISVSLILSERDKDNEIRVGAPMYAMLQNVRAHKKKCIVHAEKLGARCACA